MWKFHGVNVDELHHGYRLLDDEHLAHLLGLPATKYLVYRSNESDKKWLQANAEGIESFSKETSDLILYRHEDVNVSECKELMRMMGVVDDFEVEHATDSEDSEHGQIASEGWSTSSILSYPYDFFELDHGHGELDETGADYHDGHAVQEQDLEDEVIPSSQGSLEDF